MSRWGRGGYLLRGRSEPSDAEKAAMPRQGWGPEWTIIPDIGEHNPGCRLRPDHYGSCDVGPRKQAQCHRRRDHHVFYELPPGGGEMIYCGGSKWLPCAMCNAEEAAARYRSSMLALSRFMVWVYLEAAAVRWAGDFEPDLDQARNEVFLNEAFRNGWLSVAWPEGRSEQDG